MFNVHTTGGAEMMRRTADAVLECAQSEGLVKPLLLGVTILTSADALTLRDVGFSADPADLVPRLAELADLSGMDGVVASAREAGIVRSAVTRPDFVVVTPGVRPAGSDYFDQKRVVSPRAALSAGADYIVVGRPILDAPDPAQAARGTGGHEFKQRHGRDHLKELNAVDGVYQGAPVLPICYEPVLHYDSKVTQSLKLATACLLLVLGAFALPVSAQQPEGLTYQPFSPAPYSVGERLTYNVSFSSFIAAAHVETQVVSRGTFFGRDGIKLTAHVETNGIVSAALFGINNDYAAYVDPVTGQPFHVEQTIRQNSRTARTVGEFSHREMDPHRGNYRPWLLRFPYGGLPVRAPLTDG